MNNKIIAQLYLFPKFINWYWLMDYIVTKEKLKPFIEPNSFSNIIIPRHGFAKPFVFDEKANGGWLLVEFVISALSILHRA